MDAWSTWFKSIADKVVDKGGLWGGRREISDAGINHLPMGIDSITGYVIINADSFDAAEDIAKTNPYIASIRVYEIMTR